MNILPAVGVALLLAVITAVLRTAKSPLALFFAAAGGILLFLYLLPVFASVREAALGILGGEETGDLLSLALRGVGIALLSEAAAGVARDLGEGAVADRLLLVARGAILLLSLPTVVEILTLAVEYASV